MDTKIKKEVNLPKNSIYYDGILKIQNEGNRFRKMSEEEMNSKLSLWEILVPTIRNNGSPIRLRFHKVWDNKIRSISGGLTICPVAKGQWLSPSGTLFTERMIPVRIIATEKQISDIIDYTMKYYEQEAVLAYKISDQVILRYKDEKKSTNGK